jgi:hypothetical protein
MEWPQERPLDVVENEGGAYYSREIADRIRRVQEENHNTRKE